MCLSSMLGLLLFIVQIWSAHAADRCPSKCGSCKYDTQGHVTEAKCSDIDLHSLPKSIIKLHVSDKVSFTIIPFGDLQNHNIAHFEQLQWLKIENYGLSSLTGQCFEYVPGLTFLDLSKNHISKVAEENFKGLTNMTYLNLNQNVLQTIGANTFRQLSALTDLHIALNKLQSLHDYDFSGLTNIMKIDLQSNEISSIDENTFSILTTLEEINLQHNQLTYIGPNVFKGMTKLQTINLQMNMIQTLDPYCMSGTKLVSLKLALNQIPEIPTQLLRNISNFNLTVNLGSNNITQIGNFSLAGVSVNKLILVANGINLIQPEALRNSFFKILDLQQNLLRHIPESIAKDINVFNTILLANNPWTCDCDIQWLGKLLDGRNPEPACAEPPSYFGSKVTDAIRDFVVSCGNNGQNPLPAPTKNLAIPPRQNVVTPHLDQRTGHEPRSNRTTAATISSEHSNDPLPQKDPPIWPIIVGVLTGLLVLGTVMAVVVKRFFYKSSVNPDPAMKVSRADVNQRPTFTFKENLQTAWEA